MAKVFKNRIRVRLCAAKTASRAKSALRANIARMSRRKARWRKGKSPNVRPDRVGGIRLSKPTPSDMATA